MFEPLKTAEKAHFYACRSVLLNVHWGDFTAQDFRAIGEVCEQMVKKHHSYSSIVVVRGQYGVELSGEVRAAAAQLTSRFQAHTRAQALVLEADGFKASIVRSVITAVNLLARSDLKTRVYKDPTEATLWVGSLDEQPEPVRSVAQQMASSMSGLLAGLPL